MDENFIRTKTTLHEDHLGIAIDAFNFSKLGKYKSKIAFPIILHGYFGLESAVNLIGHELFFDHDSAKFIKEKNRDFFLRKLIKSWKKNYLSCIDKIEFILEYYHKEIPDNLKNRLIELNKLRNYLAHGVIYRSDFLLEPDPVKKNVYWSVDSEDDKEWGNYFQTTNFNAPKRLNSTDAEKALRIVLETLVLLVKSTNQTLRIASSYDNEDNSTLIEKESDIDKIINLEF